MPKERRLIDSKNNRNLPNKLLEKLKLLRLLLPELKSRLKVKRRSELLKKRLMQFVLKLPPLKPRDKDLMTKKETLPLPSNKRK